MFPQVTPLALSEPAQTLLIIIGAIVVGAFMLWVLGHFFRFAVEAVEEGHMIMTGVFVLLTVVLILAYGWVLGELLS